MINAHPFPIFESAALQKSLAAIRAPQEEGVQIPSALRKAIMEPLCDATESAGAERLAIGRRRNDTVYAIAVGKQLFPIATWSSGRSTETHVYPPVARDRYTPDALRIAANEFGNPVSEKKASFQQEALRAEALGKWLDAFYGSSLPEPLVVHTKDKETTVAYASKAIDDGAFANEVHSLVDLLLRTAKMPQAPVQEASSWGTLFGFGGDKKGTQPLSTELRNLASPRLKTSEAAGPPTGLADDLCFAGVWRDRIIALTSQRSEGGRTRLWIEDSVDGRACFREIPTPDDLPSRGVSMALVDDEVQLFGGAHPDGSITAGTWTYSLQNAAHSGFAGNLWRQSTEMPEPTAWPVVANVGRDVYLADGVEQLTEAARRNDFRMPVMARGLRRLQNMRWLNRSSPPSDTTGATVASDRRVIVVGPGNARDGKLFMCDTAQESTWYTLPALPKDVGMGQVILADDKVTYLGGFDADGKPSKDIYQLDLNSLTGRWDHVGTSNFVAGKARIVRRNGKLAAIMMTPTASRVYHIGA